MKTLFLLAFNLITFSFAALAADHEQLPDLSKALQGGELIDQANGDILMGYRYAYPADLEFEHLKKMLSDFLGIGWEENIEDPRADKMLKQVFKVEGINLVGYASFKNPAFPDREISLTQKKEVFEGKERSVVSITCWR